MGSKRRSTDKRGSVNATSYETHVCPTREEVQRGRTKSTRKFGVPAQRAAMPGVRKWEKRLLMGRVEGGKVPGGKQRAERIVD